MAQRIAAYSRAARAPSVAGSVGEDMVGGQVWSTSHQAYREYTKLLADRLTQIVDRETVRKESSVTVPCTVALDSDAQAALEREFPEFNIVMRPFSSPVHADWVAYRMMANYMASSWLRRYANSVIHVGGFRLPYVLDGFADVHAEVDLANASAVHSAHSDALDIVRVAQAPVTASRVFGKTISPAHARDFYTGKAWGVCTQARLCGHQAESYLVDLSQQFVSPAQFICAMDVARAPVGIALLPFSSSMLMHSEGIMPGTSVGYRFSGDALLFEYPDGVSGETCVSTASWHQWTMATVRSVPNGREGGNYQFELHAVRGPFLTVQVTRLPERSKPPAQIMHALDMPEANDMTLVKAWKLRTLGESPFRRSSWEAVQYTVPTRVVEKTYEYGMSIPPGSFTRYAIRKRLSVTNDRVIVQGTNVEIHAPLSSSDMDALELALFTRCFIDRYETGRLSSVLQSELAKIAAFSGLKLSRKTSVIMAACASIIWDTTVGKLDNWIRGFCDCIRRWLGGNAVPVEALFEPVPEYILYSNLTRSWRQDMQEKLSKMASDWPTANQIVPGARGCFLAWFLGSQHKTVGVPQSYEDFRVRSDGATEYTGVLFSDYVNTREPGMNVVTDEALRVVQAMRQANDFHAGSQNRHILQMSDAAPTADPEAVMREDYSLDPGYMDTMNDLHEAAFPGMASQDFLYDPTSISVDDQDRSMAADRLVLPYLFGEVPMSKPIYASKLRAYGVTKRPQVFQETLSAAAARNLSAPVVARPQDMSNLVADVWNNFLDVACHEEARQQLKQYQEDIVGLQEEAYQDWLKKAKPGGIKAIDKEMMESFRALEEMDVGEYIAMLKSDAKPPLSDKPLRQRVEPQVIVYHAKPLTSLFSSIFRVLVRRLQSLLKSNFQLNLLKDLEKLRQQVQAHHPWGANNLKFLENDFSKYDKSQGEFAFALEEYVFRQLGMDETLLRKWEDGHEHCNVRSMALGISLHVRYQRKSGDATTAFGNGILNIMSVLYAYRGTDIAWALFMGDDSLICAREVVRADMAVQALAEQFNLLAKFYITAAPYFASNFVLLHEDRQSVSFVPDPLKRIQKFSMAVSADEPMWKERYESVLDTLSVYKHRARLQGLGYAICQRYSLEPNSIDVGSVADAIATATSTFERFRAMWSERREVVSF